MHLVECSHGFENKKKRKEKKNEGKVVIVTQSYIRSGMDSELVGSVQHQWMRGHSNIRPEIAWSMFRRRFAPGFENSMENAVHNGVYNPEDDFEQ